MFQLRKKVCLSIGLTGFLYSTASVAAEPFKFPDMSTMIQNLSSNMPSLMQLVTAIAYVLGMYFILKGIVGLKHFGEGRTAGANSELKGPLILIGVGGALLFLPTSVQVGLTTFWQTPTPYAYVTEDADPWQKLIENIFVIVQLIGTVALIRGLIILTHLGGQQSQQGAFGKAMAHIVGGILCINIYQFIQAILATLGVGMPHL